MYEVSFKIIEQGLIFVETMIVSAASKVEAVSIARQQNDWNGLTTWKYEAKKL